MSAFSARIDQLRMAFGRLTQREQTMVMGGGVGAVLLGLIIITLLVGGAISKTERRITRKTADLQEVLQKQGILRARQQEQKRLLEKVRSGGGSRLVRVVEDAARQAGFSLGQVRPEDGQPNESGVVESRVHVRAQGLSIDRLQDFLARLEGARGVVILKRLKINRPYRKDTLDMDLTVMTYQLKKG